jgi:hypothetical protein
MGSLVRGILIGLVVLAVLAGAGWRVVEAGVTEHYSPGWYSRSSAEAARKGVLLRRPVVVAESLTYKGMPLRVTDAWIEQVTHVEYPLYLWRRVVRDSAERLVILTHKDAGPEPEIWCDEGVSIDGGYEGRLAHSGTFEQGQWFTSRTPGTDPPFPDTIRVVMSRKGEGCAKAGLK